MLWPCVRQWPARHGASKGLRDIVDAQKHAQSAGRPIAPWQTQVPTVWERGAQRQSLDFAFGVESGAACPV